MRTFDIHGEPKSLWQWDLNKRLVVNEYCNQVHFANRTTSEALTLQVYEENGQRLVDVPNILLQTDGPLEVYAYIAGPSERYTKKDCRFRVLTRPKPADYVYTETEVMTYEALERRIIALERSGGYGSGGLSITDDGKGNVSIASTGSVTITDDGAGNVTIG